MLVLLSHGLLFRLSLALVAVILKPNFHLKRAKRSKDWEMFNWRINFKDRQLQTTIDFLPIGGGDEITNTFPPPIYGRERSNNNNQIMINYIVKVENKTVRELFVLRPSWWFIETRRFSRDPEGLRQKNIRARKHFVLCYH